MVCVPSVVTGPIIIAIGLGLAPSAVSNCTTNWFWIYTKKVDKYDKIEDKQRRNKNDRKEKQ